MMKPLLMLLCVQIWIAILAIATAQRVKASILSSVIGMQSCNRRYFYWTQWFDEDNPPNDIELFANIKEKYKICRNHNTEPAAMEARTVKGHYPYWFPGNTLTINLAGLRCFNFIQPANKPCQDYKVRFCCRGAPPRATGIVGGRCTGFQHYWTQFYNNDSPAGLGDFENKPSTACNGDDPVAIQVLTSPAETPYEATGNLLQVSITGGARCIKSSQPPGSTCHDYKVRFCCKFTLQIDGRV